MAEDTPVTGVKVNGAAKVFTKAAIRIITKVNGSLIKRMGLVLLPIQTVQSS